MRILCRLAWGAALMAAAAYGLQSGARNPNRVLGRVLTDLERSQAHNYLDSQDRKRLDNARKDLLKFQDKWTQGHYDRRRIDSAIGNLERLLKSSRVQPPGRDRLARDLQDLREVRARREYNASRRPPRSLRPRRW